MIDTIKATTSTTKSIHNNTLIIGNPIFSTVSIMFSCPSFLCAFPQLPLNGVHIPLVRPAALLSLCNLPPYKFIYLL